MRDANCLTQKSASGMSDIFVVRLDAYSLGPPPPPPPSRVDPKRSTNPPNGGYNGGEIVEWGRIGVGIRRGTTMTIQ